MSTPKRISPCILAEFIEETLFLTQLIQLFIDAVPRHQLAVRANLCNLAVMQHNNFIRIDNR